MRNESSKNNQRIIVLLFLGILFLNLASATLAEQQVIFSSINVTINVKDNVAEYKILIEGIEIKDSFPLIFSNETNKSSANYSKENVQINFLRRIERNQTDIDVVLKAIANSNTTELYINCSEELKSCVHDIQYESNYTGCSSSLLACQSNVQQSQIQVKESNDQVSSLKTHRIILLIASLILAYGVYTFYTKSGIKKAKSNSLESYLSNNKIR